MATIRNTTPFRITAQSIGRVVDGYEVVDGLTEADADAVCASGVFERGVLVDPPTPRAEPVAPAHEPDDVSAESVDVPTEDEERPKRGTGRRSSVRAASEVEEAVEEQHETR